MARAAKAKKKVARIKSVGTARLTRSGVSNGVGTLAGFSNGVRTFNYGDIPDMMEDDQISLGLEYLKNPIAQAPIAVRVTKPEAHGYTNDLVQRVWNALIPKLDIAFAYGECCYEPLYRKDNKYIGCWDFNDFDIAPPMSAIPWVNNDKMAFAAVHEAGPVSTYSYAWFETDSIKKGTTILEGAGKMRPSKALWITNDCLLSRWFGRSVFRAAHKPWKAKQMPDGALENFLKATYRAAFSGLLIEYPAGQSVVAEDGTMVSSEQYADFMCQVIKSGSNVRLPAAVKDSPGWKITEYSKNLIDFTKLQTPLDYFDRGMLRGMGIPDEIITHDGNTGGFSRSLVAVDAFYARGETRASAILPVIIEYIVSPLVKQRFGLDCEVFAHVMRQERPDDSGGDGDGNNNGIPDALEGAMQHDKEGGSGSDDQSNFQQGDKPSRFSILMSKIKDKASPDALSHDYSSTQLDPDLVVRERILKLTDTIDRNDLAEKGVEDKPHITVKYGLHTNDVGPVEKIIKAFSGPVNVRLGDLSLFKSEKYDVLKIDVDGGDGLRKLNSKLCALPHSDEHPEYHPHLTIAYLKPGTGEKYLADHSLLGQTICFESVTFSDKNRDKTKIPMGSF